MTQPRGGRHGWALAFGYSSAELIEGELFLLAGGEVFQRCFGCVFDDGGEAGVEGGGFLEEFADVFGGFVGVAGMEGFGGFRAAAELGDEGAEGLLGFGLVIGDDEDVGTEAGGGGAEFVEEVFSFGHEAAVLEDQGEDDVAHAEADGGGWGAAEHFDEFVVAAAAGDGAFFAVGFVDFEDHAGVVGEAAGDGEIPSTPIPNARGFKKSKECRHLLRFELAGMKQLRKSSACVGRLAYEVVQRSRDCGVDTNRSRLALKLIRGEFCALVPNANEPINRALGNVDPSHNCLKVETTADANKYIAGRQSSNLQKINARGDDVGIHPRLRFGLVVAADKVHVPLPKLPQPSALRLLRSIAVLLPEPLGRLSQASGFCGVHTGEGGCELGAEGVVFFAAVAAEAEELGDDAFAGLDGVEVQVLEGGAVDFFEAVADGGVAPHLLDVPLLEQVLGVKIPGAFGGLERMCLFGGGHWW